jgi:hypothetical protein
MVRGNAPSGGADYPFYSVGGSAGNSFRADLTMSVS